MFTLKLSYCTECHDVVSLSPSCISRTCACGLCNGRYVDQCQAEYTGPAVPIGIGNSSLIIAVSEWVSGGHDNMDLCAFTIPRDCETFVKVGE